jgi:hypothetical protein
MTIAEVILLVSGGIAIYFLLRPLQRWIERRLLRAFVFRRAPTRRPIIDVTGYASHPLLKKDNHEHRS